MEELLLLLAAVAFFFALVSSKFDHSILTPPMIFTGVGVLIAWVSGHMVEEVVAEKTLEIVAEMTLVLVLFFDASRIKLPLLFRDHKIAVRLLAIGLPLSILLGTIVASWIFTDFSIWEAAIIAAILAPTDAALGQPVVSSDQVPERIRQSLNVESGLNDGIALPVVMFFAACASIGTESHDPTNWLHFWLLQVTLGPLVGMLVGVVGGYLLVVARSLHCINENFLRLSGVAVAVASWSGAVQIGGNGFIAAFVAGLAMSCFASKIGEPLRDFGEAEGQLLGLTTFLLFGMIELIPAIEKADAICYLYAFLSLTVIRVLPVYAALIGLGLQTSTVIFLGWFGPRGLASLLFGLLVIRQFDFSHTDQILTVSVLTVTASIIGHGITAVPGVMLYAKCLKK